MAEFAAAASIIALVATGTKLAIATFDFASTIGSAGKELQHIAAEVSDICSVLKQLQVVLSHAHFRPSVEALASVTRIVKQCQEVFGEIDEIVTGLRGSNNEELFPTPDFTNKIKWTFKRSKVLVLRTTLEACKSTLSVMLMTMLLAERVSQGGDREAISVADESDAAMCQSLVIAQQCAVERLEQYEDEVEKEEETAKLLPGVTTSNRANVAHRRRSRGRLVRMFTGLSVVTDLPVASQPSVQLPTRSERASIWLDSILAAPDDTSGPHPGRRQKRISSAGTATAPLQLLKKWTDQGGHTEGVSKATQVIEPLASPAEGMWRDSAFSFSNGKVDAEITVSNVRRVGTDLISPKTGRVQSIGFHKVLGHDGAIEVAEACVVGHHADDTCEAVLQSILLESGITTKGNDMTLCIYFGGKARILRAKDKPMTLLAQYEEMEMEPRLVIRQKHNT